VPTGVAVRLHITQGQSGRLATVVQYFSSTDGRSHALDLLEGNQFRAPGHDGELGFPWTGSGLQPYTQAGQVIPGPSAGGPGSFFVKGSTAVPDGGETAAQGAVSFSSPPSSVTVVEPTTHSVSYVELGYSRTVSPSGSLAFAFTYSDAFYASEVANYAATAQAAFRPSVTIVSPADGAVLSAAHATASGTASDPNGLTVLTVDGRLVSVGQGGHWTATVPLRPGANTIAATAINLLGNHTKAQSFVIFAPKRPRVSALSETHRVWSEQPRRGPGRPPAGTTFRFTLGEAAQVALEFTQRLPGRRIAHLCVPPGSRGARGPRCVRTATVATTSLPGRAGRNNLPFDGVVHGRALAPGKYTLVIVAVDTGVVSRAHLLTFTIVP
jgi:hypothetical protein